MTPTACGSACGRLARPPNGRRDWRGVVAVIIASGLALCFILLALGAVLHTSRVSLTPEEAGAISTVLGATVGALATYLGGRSDDGDD